MLFREMAPREMSSLKRDLFLGAPARAVSLPPHAATVFSDGAMSPTRTGSAVAHSALHVGGSRSSVLGCRRSLKIYRVISRRSARASSEGPPGAIADRLAERRFLLMPSSAQAAEHGLPPHGLPPQAELSASPTSCHAPRAMGQYERARASKIARSARIESRRRLRRARSRQMHVEQARQSGRPLAIS